MQKSDRLYHSYEHADTVFNQEAIEEETYHHVIMACNSKCEQQ